MAEVDQLHESGELKAYFAEQRRAYRERYRNEGIAHGERTLLLRQVARKFGAGADERLASLLADIANTDLLATVGEWIIDCDTLEEVVARLRTAADRAGNRSP